MVAFGGPASDFFDLCRTMPAPGLALHPAGTCRPRVSSSFEDRRKSRGENAL